MNYLGKIKLLGLMGIMLTSSACSMKDRAESHSISVDIPRNMVHAKNSSSMLIGNISTVADFDCFALNVTGPGISNDSRFVCPNPNHTMGIVAGFVPAVAGSIDLNVPAGPSRKVDLIGVQSNIACPILDALLAAGGVNAFSGLGDPYILGSATTDLFEDVSVSITAAYDPNAKAFQGCGASNVNSVAITSPVPSSLINVANNSSSFPVSGTCNREGESIVIKIDGVVASTTTCSSGVFSVTNVNTNSLAQGSHSFTAELTYNAEVTTSTSILVSKDTIPPSSATTLTWSQSNPTNIVSDTAIWSPSVSADLANQKIQLYSDGSCTTPMGSLVDLNSSLTNNFAVSGSDGNTYSFKVSSIDAAGNSTITSCSTSLSIDTVPPTIGITSPLPSAFINIATNSPSYSITGNCSEIGASVIIKSDGVTVGTGTCSVGTFSTTINSTTLSEAPHHLTATITDLAGNITTSSSVNVTKDVTAPVTPTALTWIHSSPSPLFAQTATWVPSISADLATQKIQFYADASCTVVSGSLITLASVSSSSSLLAGINNTNNSYKIFTKDNAGNETISSCSYNMNIFAPPLTLSPTHFSFPTGQAINQQFVALGGSGTGYTYNVDSGSGAINPTTGLFNLTGARTPGTTTVVSVTDANGTSTSTTISHVVTLVNGIVKASASDATNLYLGGQFTAVHPMITKSFMSVDAVTGALKDYGIASGFDPGATIKAVLISEWICICGGFI